MIGTWPCPLADGQTAEELLISVQADNFREDSARKGVRMLVIPPLFTEHNLMRRQLLNVMRFLAEAGISSDLPDLPGWNESTQPLPGQSLDQWRSAVSKAAKHVGATHVLAVRSGCLLLPSGMSGTLYAPQSGAKLLRNMIRAQSIANREAGMAMTAEEIAEIGRTVGVTLSGWHLSPHMFSDLETADVVPAEKLSEIPQSDIGSAGLWLRAEPSQDAQQASRIAHIIADQLGHF